MGYPCCRNLDEVLADILNRKFEMIQELTYHTWVFFFSSMTLLGKENSWANLTNLEIFIAFQFSAAAFDVKYCFEFEYELTYFVSQNGRQGEHWHVKTSKFRVVLRPQTLGHLLLQRGLQYDLRASSSWFQRLYILHHVRARATQGGHF